MNISEALSFLRRHQPLPSSYCKSSDSAIRKFAEITHFLTDVAPLYPEALDLVLGAIGEGDGHGAFANVDSLIWSHPSEIVIPVLARALTQLSGNAVSFAAMFCLAYEDKRLVEPLRKVLMGDKGNEAASKSYALMSLAAFGKNPELRIIVREALDTALSVEADEGLRFEIEETLKNLGATVGSKKHMTELPPL